MENIKKVATDVIALNEGDNTRQHKNTATEIVIRGAVTDVLNVFKNITETSINEKDRDLRIADLCIKAGVSFYKGKFY